MSKEKKTVHLICNAHIDPVWLWDRTEGIGAAISTFRTAVRICKKYGNFVFNHNEAMLYEYIEEYDKPLFDEIRELVKAGKWNIMGGWYIQPDCNMPSGEAFVRQIEVGRRYFKEKFGIDTFKTAINFDPFGHTVGLVQIMAKAGYENYICCRPGKIKGMEGDPGCKVFEWDGYCNSRIYVFKPHRYNSSLGDAASHFPEFLKMQEGRGAAGVLWGIGDHGGGPSERDMADIEEYIKESPYEVIHSTPDKFFDDYKAHEVPACRFKGSLQAFAVGCYTTMTRIKKGNRQLENKLMTAEKISSTMLANKLINEFPGKSLEQAWKDLLFAQFHDSLPGSSIQKVEDDVILTQGRGIANASDAVMKAYFAGCGGQTPPKAGEQPVMVYNPHPYEVDTSVECEYMREDSNFKKGDFTVGLVYDENGVKLECQNEKESSNLPIDWAKKVVFNARLAPMSVSRFNIVGALEQDHRAPEFKPVDGKFVLDNGELRVVIGQDTGLIESYRVNGREFIKGEAGKLLVIQDNVDPWEMRNLSFRNKIGEFRLADPTEAAKLSGVTPKQLAPVRVIENGEVRVVIEAAFKYDESSLCVRYYLPKRGSLMRINLRLFSMNRHVMLKYSLPTTLENAEYTAMTTYGRDKLCTDGDECVGQGWVMLSDGKNALGVINAQSYGSDCADGEMRMSVLRTPAYSAHPIEDREILPVDRLTPHIDMGERLFDYYLFGGDAKHISDEIDYECGLIQQPPIPLCYLPSSEGKKPLPFAVIGDHGLQLVTVKPAVGGGYTLRLFNTRPEALDAEVELPIWNKKFSVSAAPFEILTYHVGETGEISPAKLIDA